MNNPTTGRTTMAQAIITFLKNQYVDEFIIGFEREIAPNLSVGIKYNHRKLGDVIEDFLVPDPAGLGVGHDSIPSCEAPWRHGGPLAPRADRSTSARGASGPPWRPSRF